MMDVGLEQRPPPLSKAEYDDAVSRNLYVWSQWRIDVNKALIEDLQTGTRNPVRPLDQALREPSIFDDPDSRKKVDDPTTLLNYCSGLNQGADFSTPVFLQYGIPRARINQRDAHSSPHSSQSGRHQANGEQEPVGAIDIVPSHQQDPNQRDYFPEPNPTVSHPHQRDNRVWDSPPNQSERERYDPGIKGPPRAHDISNQDHNFARPMNAPGDTRETHDPNTRRPMDDRSMIPRHPGGYDKHQFDQLPKRVYPEVHPLSHQPRNNIRQSEDINTHPLSSQPYRDNIGPARGQTDPQAHDPVVMQPYGANQNDPRGSHQGYGDRDNPALQPDPTTDLMRHPEYKGDPRKYDQHDQAKHHGYSDRPPDRMVHGRYPDHMNGRPQSPQSQLDMRRSAGNTNDPNGYPGYAGRGITDPPPRGQPPRGHPEYPPNPQSQPDLRGNPEYASGPMNDPRYDRSGRPNPPGGGKPDRGQSDYPQNHHSQPDFRGNPGYTDGPMSDPRYDGRDRPNSPPRGQPPRGQPGYPQNSQPDLMGHPGYPDGPRNDPRNDGSGHLNPPSGGQPPRGQPGYPKHPQSQPDLRGNPVYPDGPRNDVRGQPPRGQPGYPQNPQSQPDPRGNPGFPDRPRNDPRYDGSAPPREQPRPLPVPPDSNRSQYSRGILDSEFYNHPHH